MNKNILIVLALIVVLSVILVEVNAQFGREGYGGRGGYGGGRGGYGGGRGGFGEGRGGHERGGHGRGGYGFGR